MKKSETILAVHWENAPESALIEIQNGICAGIEAVKPPGVEIHDQKICFNQKRNARVHIRLKESVLTPGTPTTKVTVHAGPESFSFLVRDVVTAGPLVIPEFRVMVLMAEDARDYQEVCDELRARGGLSKQARMAAEPEESAGNAAECTRRIYCPTFLGLGRDMRWFEINTLHGPNRMEGMISISPHLASAPLRLAENNWSDLQYIMMLSRGQGCALRQTRWLDDGILPVLNVRIEDGEDEVDYNVKLFCSLETNTLDAESPRGTDYLVADGFSSGHMFSPEQIIDFKRRLAGNISCAPDEMLAYLDAYRRGDGSHADGHAFTEAESKAFIEQYKSDKPSQEEIVLFMQTRATNRSHAPRYAWLRMPMPKNSWHYDAETGYARFNDSGRVFCVARLNGVPMSNEEIAVLLQPGETALVEFVLPHCPVSSERAKLLTRQSVSLHHSACRKYWLDKIARGARIEVPERRIQEMWQAGLLHLDLVMYGHEPDGTLAPSCGSKYPALGPESVNMIQFMDSMGRHDIARRCLDYFLDKQRPDGAMLNYGGHSMDACFVLWTLAEHYAYTRDDDWLRERAERILRSCSYLTEWRARDCGDDPQGKAAGLIAGQTADMKEVFHGYKLNAAAAHGLAAIAGVLAVVRPTEAEKIRMEAEDWRGAIRRAVARSLTYAPVVPLSDGTWTSSISPWPEIEGPACLDHTRSAWTHGTFMTRDNTTASNLIFHGILDPSDPLAERLMRYETDMYHVRNVRHSQPYISRHPWVHLRRRETHAFLKAYYNGLMSLADRETFSFWEHYSGVCIHKSEGESAFLMQTRWMLWLEEGASLALLPGIPRAWLESGKCIRLENVATYFGPVSLTVFSEADANVIMAQYELDPARRPPAISIRLPHPCRQHPRVVAGGVYDEAAESVVIRNPSASGEVRLEF